MMIRILLLTVLLIMSLPLAAQTGTVIIIDQGVQEGRPIAVNTFEWIGKTDNPPQYLGDVIRHDMQRSGLFDPIEKVKIAALGVNPKVDDPELNFATWRALKVESLILGRLTETGRDTFSIEVALFDVFRQKQLVNEKYTNIKKHNLRMQAHKIADNLFKELTGFPGAFATRLAYVSHKAGAKEYKLYVTDSDGYNRQSVLKSKAPILTPNWSSDGEHIAYALKEGLRWEIIIQNLYSTERVKLSNIHPALKNSNRISAPSFSPDGKRLAFSMNNNNNSDIYVAGIKDGYFKRLTTHFEIDTEPAWMPDGSSIVFTSGRGGNPQLYKKSINGGPAKRLTFEGGYNARASISPDGKNIVFVHGRQSDYYIGLLDVERGRFNVISETPGALYESPSFAPNGQMIVYTAGKKGGRHTPLAVVSIDGRSNYRVESTVKDDIQEPAWSDYLP